MAKIQLALDFSDLDKALAVAKACSGYVDSIEAGTPLIKSEGLKAVRQLRRQFPGKILVADMKTMDTGAFETGLAADAGADVTTVCGAADIATIQGAIEEGRKRGIAVAVDMINVPQERWKEIDSLGPDYIIMHVGIDQQHRGVDLFGLLKKMKVKSKLMVAGGIHARNIQDAVDSGADIIIIGGAITKARDPAMAAKEIKEAVEKP